MFLGALRTVENKGGIKSSSPWELRTASLLTSEVFPTGLLLGTLGPWREMIGAHHRSSRSVDRVSSYLSFLSVLKKEHCELLILQPPLYSFYGTGVKPGAFVFYQPSAWSFLDAFI